MRIRRAQPSDVPAMLAIRAALAFQEERSARGGFLLGTDAEGYRHRIEHGLAWVLADHELRGFAIVLPDALFRGSELWARRDHVDWDIDPGPVAAGRLGYYDQLAVLPGRGSRYATALALTAVMDLMRTGADSLLTSTVSEPVANRAAIPYVMRLGGQCVGRIDEHYPVIGPLVSDVWLVTRSAYEACLASAASPAERWWCKLALEAVEE